LTFCGGERVWCWVKMTTTVKVESDERHKDDRQ
jgi:hypothetical protein